MRISCVVSIKMQNRLLMCLRIRWPPHKMNVRPKMIDTYYIYYIVEYNMRLSAVRPQNHHHTWITSGVMIVFDVLIDPFSVIGYVAEFGMCVYVCLFVWEHIWRKWGMRDDWRPQANWIFVRCLWQQIKSGSWSSHSVKVDRRRCGDDAFVRWDVWSWQTDRIAFTSSEIHAGQSFFV